MKEYNIKKFKEDLKQFEKACKVKKESKKRMISYLGVSNITISKRGERRFIMGCKELLKSSFKKDLKPIRK
jgi:hypothetical protein